ncbi:hypothetical protein ACTU6U_02855 [Microbacterium sp. A196]
MGAGKNDPEDERGQTENASVERETRPMLPPQGARRFGRWISLINNGDQ